jgi:hypothetical protein
MVEKIIRSSEVGLLEDKKRLEEILLSLFSRASGKGVRLQL